MTPAELVKATRARKGITQRSLAIRAGTSQSAIARIESGAEEVTWPRLRSLMISMGEEPVLSSRPLQSRYDSSDLALQRARPLTARLENGLAFNRFASELRESVQSARSRG
jgi:transcriptional regulator with XRE-family HTH domain